MVKKKKNEMKKLFQKDEIRNNRRTTTTWRHIFVVYTLKNDDQIGSLSTTAPFYTHTHTHTMATSDEWKVNTIMIKLSFFLIKIFG